MSYILDALRKADAGRREAGAFPAIGAALQGPPPPRATRWPWVMAGLASTLALGLAALLLDGGSALPVAPLRVPAAPAAEAAPALPGQQLAAPPSAAGQGAVRQVAAVLPGPPTAPEPTGGVASLPAGVALPSSMAPDPSPRAGAPARSTAGAPLASAGSPAAMVTVPVVAPPDMGFRAEVIGVMDGCKVELRRADDAFIAELHGVVCPEREDPLAREARRFTTRAIFTREVQVQPSAPVSGSYISAELLMPDGQSLNAALVALGLAWTLHERYAPVEAEARRRQLGMWAAPAR